MDEGQVKKMSGIFGSSSQLGELLQEQDLFQLVRTDLHAHEALQGLEVAICPVPLGFLQILYGQSLSWPENEQILIRFCMQ